METSFQGQGAKSTKEGLFDWRANLPTQMALFRSDLASPGAMEQSDSALGWDAYRVRGVVVCVGSLPPLGSGPEVGVSCLPLE